MTSGVIEQLTDVVEGLSVAADADELTALFRLRDRVEARTMEGFTTYYASGGCDADGLRSPVAWLRAHVPLTEGEAKARGARAKALVLWPTLARLWFDGHLNGAQVAVVVAAVPRKLMGLYADHDDEVSPLLVGLCVADTKTAIGEWVTKAESVTSPDPQEAVDPDAPSAEGHLRVSRYGSEDTAAIRGEADGDTATIIETAIGAAERPDVDGECRTPGQRRLEALRSVCEFYLAHADCEGGAGTKARMVVVCDLPDLYRSVLFGLGVHDGPSLERFLAKRPVSVPEEGILRHALAVATGTSRTLDGLQLSPAAVTTIFGAGSTMERMMMADGQVLDHGRKVRLAKGPLRDAMLVRDLGCRFPTATGERCDAPISWIDGHHITQWEHDGDTSLANLVCLCAAHHGVVHRDGWVLLAGPDGTMTLTRPDGTTLTSPPPWNNRPLKLPLHHWRLAGITLDNDSHDDDEPGEDDASHAVDPRRDDHGHVDLEGGDEGDEGRGERSCPLTQPVPTVTIRFADEDEVLDALDPVEAAKLEAGTIEQRAAMVTSSIDGLVASLGPRGQRPPTRPHPARRRRSTTGEHRSAIGLSPRCRAADLVLPTTAATPALLIEVVLGGGTGGAAT